MLSLDSFAGGILREKMNNAIEAVANNIMDPKMDPKAKRKIKVTLTFSVKEPTLQNCGVLVETVLAPEKESMTTFGFVKDLETDTIEFVESGNQIPGQMSFADFVNDKTMIG